MQCPQLLVTVHFAHQISWYPRVDGSECNGPELEVDMLANRQPVQLLLQLTDWNKVILELPHGRVLDTLEMSRLRWEVTYTVAVVETLTDDTNCNRLGSIECETWTEVA